MNSIGTVLYATGGSRLSVSNVNVSGNTLLEAFSRKIASDFTLQTSRNFNVLLATDSSQATGNGFIVADNNGMDVSCLPRTIIFVKILKEPYSMFEIPRIQRVFCASNSATVSITDAMITNCNGTSVSGSKPYGIRNKRNGLATNHSSSMLSTWESHRTC
jgi:hypothetical protein